MRYIAIVLFIALSACGKDPKTIQGPAGPQGGAGSNGSNGHNSLIATIYSAPSCTTGGIILLVGLDLNDDNSLAGSEVTSSAQICNGTNGSNGHDGLDGHDGSNGQDGHDAPPTPFTPTGIVDPCGDAPGVYDEVFIRLANGTLVASFSENASGKNTRFSVLTPGTYQTTDGDNCVFTVDANNNIINEHH